MENLAQMLNYIGSKEVLNIEGMDIETARKIIEYLEKRKGAKLIPEEVYSVLEMSDFTMLPGFTEESAENLVKAVETANKNVPLPNFFAALAFEGIGITVGTLLAERYHNINFYVMAGMNENFKEELLKIDGIDEDIADILDSEKFKFRIDVLCTHIEPLEYTGR